MAESDMDVFHHSTHHACEMTQILAKRKESLMYENKAGMGKKGEVGVLCQ